MFKFLFLNIYYHCWSTVLFQKEFRVIFWVFILFVFIFISILTFYLNYYYILGPWIKNKYILYMQNENFYFQFPINKFNNKNERCKKWIKNMNNLNKNYELIEYNHLSYILSHSIQWSMNMYNKINNGSDLDPLRF